MNRCLTTCCVFAAAAMAVSVSAQRLPQAAPEIGYVYPAGGQAGTTFLVTVGGQHLNGVSGVLISGGGVQATLLDQFKPLTQQEFRALGKKLQDLMKKKQKTMADLKEIADLRKKIASYNRNATPAIAETAIFQVTVATNAVVGERELRLITANGLSNPRLFSIGQLPEVSKKMAKDFNEQTGFRPSPKRGEQEAAPPAPEMTVTIPCVINGQILPSQADRYRFSAKRGQRLVISTSARELTPYISDAVPGWFQAVITLYDTKGRELAYNDDFRFRPDPVLYYEIPEDGQYVLEIRDAIYRGREDFVYRITVAEAPFITSIFPLGGKAGVPTTIEVKGWNLPINTLRQDKDCPPGIFPVYVAKDGWISNRLPFVVDPLPQAMEKEPNNDIANAQPITMPIVINGRIDTRGDKDVFCLHGRAGEEIVAEIHARRLDSPLDSLLRITDAAGKTLAVNDDHEDKASGLNTHHADSYLRIQLPATGKYYVHLADAQHKGGSEYAYRLRISPPQHDFELRVVPSSINVRAGSSAVLTVYALRKDGYNGDITLSLKNAPEGFKLHGGLIPAGQDHVPVTLTVPTTANKEPVSIAIEGRALIGAKQIVRPAVPADDMMQAFAYHHLVPAKELKVAIAGGGVMEHARAKGRPELKVADIAPVKIPAGGTAKVNIGLPLAALSGSVKLELSEPPDGIAIQKVNTSRDGTEIVLATEADKVQPGLKGNLIVHAYPPSARKAPKGATAQPRVPLVTLPAIPFEVVAR